MKIYCSIFRWFGFRPKAPPPLAIICLSIAVIYIYIKKYKNKEGFIVQFLPQVHSLPYNNNKTFNKNLPVNKPQEDKRLDTLKYVLDEVKKEINKNYSNTDYNTYKVFNVPNIPVDQEKIGIQPIKKLIDYLLNNINVHLTSSYYLKLDSVTDIFRLKTDDEAKINLKMICNRN